MFCYQCEQTRKSEGCNMQGICGKDAETAALFGKKPAELGYLRLAEQKGLGSIGSYSRKEISL